MNYRFHHKDRERIDNVVTKRRTIWPPRRYQRHLQFPEPESTEHAKDLIMDCSVAEVKHLDRNFAPWGILLDGVVWEGHETRAEAVKQARKFSKVVRGKIGDPTICDQRLLLFLPPRYGYQPT